MSNHLLDHSTWISKGILNASMSKTETSPPPHHLQKTLLYLQYTSPSQLVATPPFQLLRSETVILRTASSSHLPYSHCLNHCCLVTKSCLTLWVPKQTAAHQAPPSLGFSRQEHWSGLPFPSIGDLPDPEMEPMFPAWQVVYTGYLGLI